MKHRVTFEVDTSTLFDMVAKIGDGGQALGIRIVGALLAPDSVGFSTDLGMGVYGISIFRAEGVPMPKPDDGRWPSGCLKPNSCGRHAACMYGSSVESCRHYGRNLVAEVEAASRERHPEAAATAMTEEGR